MYGYWLRCCMSVNDLIHLKINFQEIKTCTFCTVCNLYFAWHIGCLVRQCIDWVALRAVSRSGSIFFLLRIRIYQMCFWLTKFLINISRIGSGSVIIFYERLDLDPWFSIRICNTGCMPVWCTWSTGSLVFRQGV